MEYQLFGFNEKSSLQENELMRLLNL